MKIFVIFTGGTIGSSLNGDWISPDNQTKKVLLDGYEQIHGNSIEFVTTEPYSILSEHLNADNLNQLISTVKSGLDESYDGIIVTHGSDTLQYSAAALDFACGSCDIPVVLVAANYPLDDSRSNGQDNFAAAVEFIKVKAGKGIFVSYKNQGQPVHFHKGLSLLSHAEWDDKLFSFGEAPYAQLTEKGVVVNKEIVEAKPISFTLCEQPKILVVDSCPEQSYDYNPENYKAIILRPYHSGTLDTANPCFEKFCNKAAKSGTPVFVTNVKEGIAYESAKTFDNLKIIPIYNLSFIGAYVRIWIAVSNNEQLNNLF